MKLSRRTKRALRLTVVVFSGLLILAVLGGIALLLFGKWGVWVTLHGGESVVVEVGSTYEEEGAEAYYGSRRIALFERKPLAVEISGEVDTAKPGTYEVRYTATDGKKTSTAIRFVVVADTRAPEITLHYRKGAYTPIGGEYSEEGYTAFDSYEGDLTDRVKTEIPGDGFVYYTVSDSAGNTAHAKREILYDDRTPPVVKLEGGTVTYVDIRREYEEPGYSASDDCDGDVTSAVTVKTMPGATEAETIISYEVADSHGNVGWATRIVVRKDLETPEITLTEGDHVTVFMGERFHEPGFTAVDHADGDLTEQVAVEGEIDNFTAGDYEYTYRVTDSDGYEAVAKRIVSVVPREQPETVKPEGKVVYLTFDDGPCVYTEHLLDVLAKYDVKVTFFVTNQFPGWQNLIKREAEEGHTVAIHTYCHDYPVIYKSRQAYLDDLNAMNDIIEEQTGRRTTILRFPGGSSNAVSRGYCVGLMTQLTNDLTDAGFQYFDWNVQSGDSDGATSAAEVANNVIRGIQHYNISIVLQHDIKAFSVDAVEQIIKWGLENGYTFLPLQPDSPTVHHRLNN